MSDSIISYLMESRFGRKLTAAVFEAYGAIFEATNINKAYLVQQAGGDEQFKSARDRVRSNWDRQTMDQFVRNPNQAQKVINFLILMEIRQPGFVDDTKLGAIHDLTVQNCLEQRFLSKVNSDTTAPDAADILGKAVAGAAQAAKVYPTLSESDEKIWNRVKVYHEFETGFKWVYAVDDSGAPIGYMPSRITFTTMSHCGNAPTCQDGDQYWALRGPDGREYLTVILDSNDHISESKSFANEPSRYADLIKPYVKWFLRDQKVKGVGHRYSYGYAPDKNFGVKDFVDEPEFISEIKDTKPALLGAIERRMMMLRDALAANVVTPKDLGDIYAYTRPEMGGGGTEDDPADIVDRLETYIRSHELYDPKIFDPNRFYYAHLPSGITAPYRGRIFGENGFAVLCGACGGCPYDEARIIQLAEQNTLWLYEFANYSTKLLTDPVQEAFVRGSGANVHPLHMIAKEVATFKVSENITRSLGESNEEYARDQFLEFVAECNPKEKAEPYLQYIRDTDWQLLLKRSKFDVLIEIDNRFDGALGDLTEVIHGQIERMIPESINERNRGGSWSSHYYMDKMLSALAKSSPEKIAMVSSGLPGDTGIRIMMNSENNTSICTKLGVLGESSPVWKVPSDYIDRTIDKINDRSRAFSVQTQSMLVKILSYVDGIPDKDEVTRIMDRISIDIYSHIYHFRNETGRTISLWRALGHVIGTTPQLFTAEMILGTYDATDNVNGRYGRNALSWMYRHTGIISQLAAGFLNADKLKLYMDTVLAASDNLPDQWYIVCESAARRNVPMEPYQDVLLAKYMANPAYLTEMLRNGYFTVPMEQWDSLRGRVGEQPMIEYLYAVLPASVKREPEVYTRIIRDILGMTATSNAGPNWVNAFRNMGPTMIAKLRDKTIEMIDAAGNVPPETIQSLVTSKVIRTADARRLMNVRPEANGAATTKANMVRLCKNIDKIDSKTRPNFITAAFGILAGGEIADMSDHDAIGCLHDLVGYLYGEMMLPQYDKCIRWFADNVERLDAICERNNFHKISESIASMALLECNRYLTGENLTEYGLISGSMFMRNTFKRPDWATHYRRLDSVLDITNDDTYWSPHCDINDADFPNPSAKAGRTEAARKAMPRLYGMLRDMSLYQRRYRYKRGSRFFGLD